MYDGFRGRIIIPIRDVSGRAIGLGGRILPDAEGPKYLNSPATPLFDKSRTLYGIDLAKGAIRREKLAVIVEGYTDVMAAHQAGFENVVASLGTALTAGQVELANRFAEAVALAYDVDLAGEAATQRGLLEELGPVVSKVRVIRIPAGKDPDELIRTDPEGWRAPSPRPRSCCRTSCSGRRARSTSASRRAAAPTRAGCSTCCGASPIGSSRTPTSRGWRSWRASTSGSCATSCAPRRAADSDPAARGRTAVRWRRPRLAPLEREALTLLLLSPGLARELEAGERVPIRDAAAQALGRRVARGGCVRGQARAGAVRRLARSGIG